MLCALLIPLSAAAADLKEVLRELGQFTEEQEQTARCTYRETTTIEELDKQDRVLGKEIRVFNVEIKGMEVVRRDIVSITPKGQPLDDLLQQPKDTKGRKAARSPLHPEAQADYRFELEEGPGEEELSVRIEPLKPSPARNRGSAVMDASSLKLKRIQLSPSKSPLLLKSLVSTSKYGETPCGWLPVELEAKGEGVAIFIETRFRSHSVLEDFKRVGPRTASR